MALPRKSAYQSAYTTRNEGVFRTPWVYDQLLALTLLNLGHLRNLWMALGRDLVSAFVSGFSA